MLTNALGRWVGGRPPTLLEPPEFSAPSGTPLVKYSVLAVIGLVGKPSAGKSTFFNAVSQPLEEEAAPMAAYPFTTIDPNIGEACFTTECPCAAVGCASTCACGGTRVRRLPVLIKDVAGLVPGAYLGRGKGNSFLNDLTDADTVRGCPHGAHPSI